MEVIQNWTSQDKQREIPWRLTEVISVYGVEKP